MALSAVRVAQHLDGDPSRWYGRARKTSNTISTVRPIATRSPPRSRRQGRRLQIQSHRFIRDCTLAAAGVQNGIDIDAVDSAVDMPYDIAHLRVEYVPPSRRRCHRFLAWCRAEQQRLCDRVLHGRAREEGGKDPIAFRRAMLGNPSLLGRSISWRRNRTGAGPPARAGRGVSVQPSSEALSPPWWKPKWTHGRVRLRRVTSAVDTGIAVNPDTIVAQLQGGLIFGLTAALYGEVTVKNGRVQQSNFNDYRMLRSIRSPDRGLRDQKREAPGASEKPARRPDRPRYATRSMTHGHRPKTPADRSRCPGRQNQHEAR